MANLTLESTLPSPTALLRAAVEPPPLGSIVRAYKDLVDIGALDGSFDYLPETERESRERDSGYDFDLDTQRLENKERASEREEREEIVDYTKVSGLGRFLSALPVDLSLGRLLAMSVILRPGSSRYLIPCIIMAASLSSPDMFLTPHPKFNGKDYPELLDRVLRYKMELDEEELSEPIMAIRVFRALLTRPLDSARLSLHRLGLHPKRFRNPPLSLSLSLSLSLLIYISCACFRGVHPLSLRVGSSHEGVITPILFRIRRVSLLCLSQP